MRLREVGATYAESYAEALYALGAAEGLVDLDELEEEYKELLRLVEETGLTPFLEHPLIEDRHKISLLKEAFPEMNPYLFNLLCLLVKRGRESYLKPILDDFIRLRERKEGILRVTIHSPYKLDGVIDEIGERLAELTEMKVKTEVVIDPEILGGIKMKVGDLMFDGTVEAQLEALKEKILSEGVKEKE